jgi:hypothetical protein
VSFIARTKQSASQRGGHSVGEMGRERRDAASPGQVIAEHGNTSDVWVMRHLLLIFKTAASPDGRDPSWRVY